MLCEAITHLLHYIWNYYAFPSQNGPMGRGRGRGRGDGGGRFNDRGPGGGRGRGGFSDGGDFDDSTTYGVPSDKCGLVIGKGINLFFKKKLVRGLTVIVNNMHWYLFCQFCGVW